MIRATKAITATSLLIFLAACGGGGGDKTATPIENIGGTSTNTDSNGSNSAGSTGNTNGGTSAGSGSASPGSGPATPAFAVDETARFNKLTDLAVDKNGNLYATDSGGGRGRIRKISASGQVSSLNGFYGAFTQIAVDDNSDYLFFSSSGYIYKLSAAGNLAEAEPTLITTLSATRCFCTRPSIGFSIDGTGNLYVLHAGERETSHGFKITPDGQATKILSAGPVVHYRGLASDRQGNLAIGLDATTGEQELLLIPNSQLPLLENPPKSMSFPFPNKRIPDDMVYDAAGNLYVIDTYTDSATDAEGQPVQIVREIEISRVAPDRTFTTIYKGLPLGRSVEAQAGAAVAVGNDGTVYFTDPSSYAIYKVSNSGQAALIAGKPGESGDSD